MKTTGGKKLATVERLYVKSGKIIATRSWNGIDFYEIKVHLPNVTFENWEQAQSIKCRINALHYTDYTPALWDIEKKTCTLYIDASHSGQGAHWAKNQLAGNDFHYLKIEAVKHFPIKHKQLIFLGDQTGIGHFSSLQQLAAKNTKIGGILAFPNPQMALAFSQNCSWLPLKTVCDYNAMYDQVKDLALKYESDGECFAFYIVGSAELVVTLRKMLKDFGFDTKQIKSKGFWQ